MQQSASPSEPSEIEHVLLAVIRHIQLVIAVPLLLGAIASVVVVLTPNRYTASTSFFPETRAAAGVGQLATLAAAAGVPVNVSEPGYSPQFFGDLLRSRPIVYAVLLHNYPRSAVRRLVGSDSLNLLDAFSIEGASLAERLELGERALQSMMSVDVDRRTGVVGLSVTSTSPELASLVANGFLEELIDFNLHSRHTQARARRTFTQGRVEDAATSLAGAEDSMRLFLERNRDYRNSPNLAFEEQRLQRQVQLRQELYLTLRRQLETDRINEVNDLPALTVIARAIPPTRKSGPQRTKIVFWVVLTAGVLAVLGVVVYERDPESVVGLAVRTRGQLLDHFARWRSARSASGRSGGRPAG